MYAEDLWEQKLSQMYFYSKVTGDRWLGPDAEINACTNETVLPNKASKWGGETIKVANLLRSWSEVYII